MIPDYALDNAETQTRPILPRGKKRLEQFGRHSGGETRPSIDHVNLDEPVFRLENLDTNSAASRAVLDRVIQQVDKDLLKPGVVRHNRWTVALFRANKFDILGFLSRRIFPQPHRGAANCQEGILPHTRRD